MNLNYFRWMPGKNEAPNLAEPKTLVFLHGLGGTGQIWRPIAAQLESQYDCVAPDQRGHGGSRPVPDDEKTRFHAEDYAQDIGTLIDQLGIQNFYLVGHSMGVRTALAVCEQKMNQVLGVIAVDIGISSEWGGGMGKPLGDFIRTLPENFPDRTSMREYLFKNCPDTSIAQYLSAVAKNTSTSEIENWVFPFEHDSLVQTIAQAHEAPIGDWVTEIVTSGVRVLFLRGANSKVWLKDEYEAQMKTYAHPLLEFEEWENCGHGLPFEQRAKFVEKIKEFAT